MKKLPVIRHMRYIIKRTQFTLWWNRIGHKLGTYPNQWDLQYLEDVWNGDA